MVKLLVKTDNITVHNSNMLVALKIVYIMEKAKLLKESISLKEIGSRAKYKVENCNGQNKMGGNTLIKANSTETYKCTARVNFTIKLGILK